jgi:hypothetical protein
VTGGVEAAIMEEGIAPISERLRDLGANPARDFTESLVAWAPLETGAGNQNPPLQVAPLDRERRKGSRLAHLPRTAPPEGHRDEEKK